MAYAVPGRADEASEAVIEHWNATIGRTYRRLAERWGSRFVAPDPAALEDPRPVIVKWSAEPAEPVSCLGGREWGRRLADWGPRGRHAVQNEYCEYAVVRRPDRDGALRPKRVQITTELREYWVCVARVDPDLLADMAEECLGARPTWEQLYGAAEPHRLSETARERAFARRCAGHGGDPAAKRARVPARPQGDLNTDNALFMTHPINGLDDLLYIVMFGAKPRAVREGRERRRASMGEVFAAGGAQHLACRHADPAAAQGVHDAAWDGATVAFADPLGMYVQTFSDGVLTVDGDPLPSGWLKEGRGRDGLVQRLVVGPPDDEPDAWLDDIRVTVGEEERPLVGGFQLLEHLEVGPYAVRGRASRLAAREQVLVPALDAPIDCSRAAVCGKLKRRRREWQAAHAAVPADGTGRPEPVAHPGG